MILTVKHKEHATSYYTERETANLCSSGNISSIKRQTQKKEKKEVNKQARTIYVKYTKTQL